MVSYNYFRILINFHLMLHLLGVYEIEFTTDHFYVLFNFVLANSINYGARLIHSQVTIFISSILWYRGSIIIYAEGHPKIDYTIAFDRLLSKICQLEENHVKVVSKVDLNTKKLVEGEFELLLKRSKILLMQEDYNVAFAIVAKKIYGSDCLEKIKESFSGLLFEVLYYSTVIEGGRQLSLSCCTDRVFSYDAELKRLRKFGQVLNNSIVIARLSFEISNYVLPMLVLLGILNTPEDYLAALKNYPFLKHGKSK